MQMTEKNRKKIVYSVFVLAVVWALFNLPFGKKTESDFSGIAEQSEMITSLNTISDNQDKLDLNQDWGADPFAIKKTTGKQVVRNTVNFKLTAISESNGTYWALINGKILSVGDNIDGWKLVEVSQTRAILSKNKETIRLKIQDA
jgi:hypothetical protein